MTKDKKKFSKKELAYICYHVKQTENKQLQYELELLSDDEKYDEDKLKSMFDGLSDAEKEKLDQYSFDDMIDYKLEIGNQEIQEKIETKEKMLESNPFLNCIEMNHDKFYGGLLGNGETYENGMQKINLSWKQTCKELLVESIKIYCTPYKKEYYIKTGENGLKYIGNNYESYLENLYSMISFQYTTLIPFSSFISNIKNLRVYEDLEPNRDYILFNDCLLNVDTGETIDKSNINAEKVPYAIIDYNYLQEDKEVQEYITDLFERIDTNNLLKSLMYGMFNKRVLKKTSAIFNIQKSNTGKTLIVTPFTEIGLFRNVNHEMLKGNDKSELFKQYYTIVFEEIQEKVINGSGFNSLVDDTSIAVPRKYKDAIDIPKELKPVVYINGESMPNFKGRTKGSYNRFVFTPNYKEPLTEKDYEYLHDKAETVGVELIRHLIKYMKDVGKVVIMINIKNSIKSEKEIFEMKENKVRIMFEYIKQDPLIDRNETYCISETILVELIKELQHQGNITVDLFNSDTSIKQFIKKTLIENMDTDIDEKETLVKKVTKDGEKQKSCRLKYIYQLTEKGKEIVTDLGYEISSLRYQ